jgi:CHASE2 domain-containing sensor protein
MVMTLIGAFFLTLLIYFLFQTADNQLYDTLFTLKYQIRGKEETKPYIYHVAFDDNDFNLQLSRKKPYLFSQMIKILTEAEVKVILWDRVLAG